VGVQPQSFSTRYTLEWLETLTDEATRIYIYIYIYIYNMLLRINVICVRIIKWTARQIIGHFSFEWQIINLSLLCTYSLWKYHFVSRGIASCPTSSRAKVYLPALLSPMPPPDPDHWINTIGYLYRYLWSHTPHSTHSPVSCSSRLTTSCTWRHCDVTVAPCRVTFM